MDISTRARFGLPPDPWAELEMRTADAARAVLLVEAAARSQAMVWVLGRRGVGKTRAVRAALVRLGVPVVEPLRLDRERLHMGDIQDAIVRDLSDERPRRSGEARSGQVRRVLGARRAAPVLFIDEAHCLHHATVRGLKRLRELSWGGRSPLAGVVLAGQRAADARIPEVALRSARTVMAGLTADEAEAALDLALNRDRTVVEPAAQRLIARHEDARTWLDLQRIADEAMAAAAARGRESVDEASAEAVLTPRERPRGANGAHARNAGAPSDDAVSAALRARRAA